MFAHAGTEFHHARPLIFRLSTKRDRRYKSHVLLIASSQLFLRSYPVEANKSQWKWIFSQPLQSVF